jgi:BMFP domain-containing protein YqiC
MQNNNKFLNDLSRMASGAVGGLMDVKREIEIMVGEQLEKLLQKMNLVTKEEFDTTQSMLTKSRNEQEELKKRLDALEVQINALTIGEKSTK